MSSDEKVLILGIGNVLWADEGFGVRAVEALHRRCVFPHHVTVMDGGTQGLYLLPHVRDCSVLIILDAVDYGLPAGTLKLVGDEKVPSYMGAKKVSLHQAGFQEVLATATLLGWEPRRVLLVGVQPSIIEDYGGSLTRLVASKIDAAVSEVLAELGRLGIEVSERCFLADDLGPAALDQAAYEQGRPAAELACRIGDDRFLDGLRG